jgi:glycosyltransferase involved in cell wall biosynthesis
MAADPGPRGTSGASRAAPAAASPSVTVVIPCYNAEKWVARTIASVLGEEYPALEVIVVDDGSTDGSAEIIRSFGDRIRVETTDNQGACAARNRGLALCRSTYVMFLDADDYIEDGLIGHLARRLEQTDAQMGFGRFAKEAPGGKRVVLDHYAGGAAPLEVFRDWMIERWIPPCSVMWRADFLNEVGAWRSDLHRNQDGELVMRAMLHGPRLCATSEGLGLYNLHDDPSVSKTFTAVALRSEMKAMTELVERARADPRRPSLLSLGHRFYYLAFLAYDGGEAEVGDEALALARGAGLQGHPGTALHKLGCALMGLKRKTQLAKALKQLR